MRKSILLIGLVVFILSLTSACGDKTHNASQSTARVIEISGNTTTTLKPINPAYLESLVVDDLPEGYIKEEEIVEDTGFSDFEKAVKDEGGADSDRARLEELQFRAGYQRIWHNEFGDTFILFLYQFGDHDKAEEFAAGYKSHIQAGRQGAWQEYEDQDISGSFVQSSLFPKDDPERQSAGVVFTKDAYMVQIIWNATIFSNSGLDGVFNVAKAQYDLL